jgi:ABC-type spermidine/putrescine transport system permease subunit II
MDKKDKAIILTLWFILILEIIGISIMIYLTRLPHFISLMVFFIQLLSPWFIAINIVFLLLTLFSKGLEFTLAFWKDYLNELFRFFAVSFIIAFVAIAISAVLGTALGLSADRISTLPTLKVMREWIGKHFY